jgi:hypothetical protein
VCRIQTTDAWASVNDSNAPDVQRQLALRIGTENRTQLDQLALGADV